MDTPGTQDFSRCTFIGRNRRKVRVDRNGFAKRLTCSVTAVGPCPVNLGGEEVKFERPPRKTGHTQEKMNIRYNRRHTTTGAFGMSTALPLCRDGDPRSCGDVQ